jgi:hypothetical protein
LCISAQVVKEQSAETGRAGFPHPAYLPASYQRL